MDLNTMMREQAQNGLKIELANAVTNGDTAAAEAVTQKIAALAVASAPPAAAYGPDQIKAELDKLPWFGVDGEKTTLAFEYGKNLNIKKFATAADFAAAVVKAVEAKFKTAPTAGEGETDGDGDGETDGDGDGEGGKVEAKPAKSARQTDGPGEGDATQRSSARGKSSGPWTKLSDAPAAIQAEINRTADKFAGKDKVKREPFVARALESHYAQHQRTKGKK